MSYSKRINSVDNTNVFYDEDDDVEIILGDYHKHSPSQSNIQSSDDEIEEKVNPNMYTMMCKNIMDKGECKRSKCTFAHTIEQLRPVTCKFDERCVNEKCSFIHSKESKDEYFERLNISHLRKKKQIKAYVIRTNTKDAREDVLIALASGYKYFTIIIDDKED